MAITNSFAGGAPNVAAAAQMWKQRQLGQQPAAQPAVAPPVAQPGAPQPQLGTAPAPAAANTFSQSNNLVGSQINPTTDPRLAGTQSLVTNAAQSLAGGPDRQALAATTFGNLEKGFADQRKLGTAQIGRDAARLGRLGSGMVTTSLGDLESRLGEQRNRAMSQLSADTAGATLQDNATRLGALSGLEGQQFEQGLTGRNELRGERGYQYGLQQDATQQNNQQNALLAQLGFGGNTASTLGGVADQYGQQGADAQAGSGDLLRQLFANRTAKAPGAY